MRARGRAAIVVAFGAGVALGCGGTKASGPPAPPLTATLPKVAAAQALAAADLRMPPSLVFLDADGALRVAAGRRADQPVDPTAWATLAATGGRAKTTPADAALLARLVAEDPPPPEEADEDDGAEESGGTGTLVNLDEAKLDQPRVDPAQRARERAIADAQPGNGGFGFGRSSGSRPPDPPDARLPRRLADVVGAIQDGGGMAPADVLILAAATAKARALIDLLGATRGLIAVSYQDTLRVVRLQVPRPGAFGPGTPAPWWLEVRVEPDALELEAVPDAPVRVPWPAGGGDGAALQQAYEAVRAARNLTARPDVDVLVGADTDVQRLVDVLVALDGAGARVIVLGATPTGDERGKRGKRTPMGRLGAPQSVGDLDKAELRTAFRVNLPAFESCYTTALATQPALAGTVSTQFFIKPDGTVMDAAAHGVSDEVAACVLTVLRGLTFPKPRGGGGVQVNYPITFRN